MSQVKPSLLPILIFALPAVMAADSDGQLAEQSAAVAVMKDEYLSRGIDGISAKVLYDIKQKTGIGFEIVLEREMFRGIIEFVNPLLTLRVNVSSDGVGIPLPPVADPLKVNSPIKTGPIKRPFRIESASVQIP